MKICNGLIFEKFGNINYSYSNELWGVDTKIALIENEDGKNVFEATYNGIIIGIYDDANEALLDIDNAMLLEQ